jgi:phosphoribosyl-ATP pyrophosphohydrolase
MDMAGQDRPKQPILGLEPAGSPSPGDLGTLKGLQQSMTQVVARVKNPTLRLRLSLVLEEAWELAEACLNEDLPMIARNAADILYVTHGIPHSMGYDGDAVFDCVHKANMTKRLGKVRSDGKQLAPVDFQPPDVRAALAKR